MKVLITGASKGLGIIVAQSYARRGASLILMARTETLLNDVKNTCENPHLHRVIPLDFRDIGIPRTFDISGVDVVVHCAGGGLGMRSPTLNHSELHDLFMVNVGGQAYINSIVLPEMQKAQRGYICHICSIASGEAVGSVGYNTVKAALAAYVRSVGREMAPHGVVVSGISPGGFRSPLGAMERLESNHPEVYRDFEKSRIPRCAFARAEELLPLIHLLTGPDGSMMAGCVVPIDAGEGRYY